MRCVFNDTLTVLCWSDFVLHVKFNSFGARIGSKQQARRVCHSREMNLGNSNGEFPRAKKLKNTDLLRNLSLRKKRRISEIHQIFIPVNSWSFLATGDEK